MMYYNSIVHISVIAVDVFNCLAPGVYGSRIVHAQNLGDGCTDTQGFSHIDFTG